MVNGLKQTFNIFLMFSSLSTAPVSTYMYMSDRECLWGVAVAGTQLQYGRARAQLHLVHGSGLCNTQ